MNIFSSTVENSLLKVKIYSLTVDNDAIRNYLYPKVFDQLNYELSFALKERQIRKTSPVFVRRIPTSKVITLPFLITQITKSTKLVVEFWIEADGKLSKHILTKEVKLMNVKQGSASLVTRILPIDLCTKTSENHPNSFFIATLIIEIQLETENQKIQNSYSDERNSSLSFQKSLHQISPNQTMCGFVKVGETQIGFGGPLHSKDAPIVQEKKGRIEEKRIKEFSKDECYEEFEFIDVDDSMNEWKIIDCRLCEAKKEEIQLFMQQLTIRAPENNLTEEKKERGRRFLSFVKYYPQCFIHITDCIEWQLIDQAKKAFQIFKQIRKVPVSTLVELVGMKSKHLDLHKKAIIQIIKLFKEGEGESIVKFLPQLVLTVDLEDNRINNENVEDLLNRPSDYPLLSLFRWIWSYSLQAAIKCYWSFAFEASKFCSKNNNERVKKYKKFIQVMMADYFVNAKGKSTIPIRNEVNKVNMFIRQLFNFYAKHHQSNSSEDSASSSSSSSSDRLGISSVNRELGLIEGNRPPFPFDPSFEICSVEPFCKSEVDEYGRIQKKYKMFHVANSAKMPMALLFRLKKRNENKTVVKGIMIKKGDDLRQDMIVLQGIQMMDAILSEQGIRGLYTCYSAMATPMENPGRSGQNANEDELSGIVEFVPNTADLKKTECIPAENSNYDLLLAQTSAAYSFPCFLFGITDRHINNILLHIGSDGKFTGKMFHIDFGYICGSRPAAKMEQTVIGIKTEIFNRVINNKKAELIYYLSLCFFHLRHHHPEFALLLKSIKTLFPKLFEDNCLSKYFDDRFFPEVSDNRVKEITENLVEKNRSTIIGEKINDVFHWIAKG